MSFRLKTIVGIAVIETVLLVILVLSGLNFLAESNEKQLQQRAITTTQLFASAAKDAVLATDLASLASITQEVADNSDVVYARVSNREIVLAESGQPEALSRNIQIDTDFSSIKDGIFDVRYEIKEAGYVYGVIELGLSTHSIQQLLVQARRWAVGIASLEVMLVAFFSFILGTYLTRQLQQLKHSSVNIRRFGPGFQLPVSGRDELADLADEFNRMSVSLAQSYQELEQSSNEHRVLAERAIRNEAMSQAILSASLDGIISIDQDGTIIEYNQGAEGILGWSQHEAVGQNMARLIVPEHFRAAHLKGMEHYQKTGEGPVLGKRLELEALHKSGRVFPIEIAISPIDLGEHVFFTAFFRDLSVQKKAEEEQRLAAQAFESIEPIFITDAKGAILRVNTAFILVTGYERHDVIGKNPRILASGRHDEAFFTSLWNELLTTGQWSGEIYNRRKNSEVYLQRLTITAVCDESEVTSHYIAHFIDISEQKATEKSLKEASEAKSRFLATMSHEIRSPLNAVVTMSSLLQETTLNPEQKHFVDIVNQGGQTLMALINNILDFSKIESNHLDLMVAEFDLALTIESVVELISCQADVKNITLRFEASPQIARFYEGDALRIRQIVTNLISNAIKFTDHGGVMVRLYTASGGDVIIEIEDTGIGIDIKYQKDILAEFVQIEDDDSRRFDGTGLGLAITQRLVDKMQGELSIASELDKGTCIKVRLPLPRKEHSHLTEKTSRDNGLDDANQSENTSLALKQILLVEDNPTNQAVALALLSKEGIEVDIAENGEQGVKQAAGKQYDLILMDLAMPVMNGIDATKLIRSQSGINQSSPIMAMTANAFAEDIQRCLKSGMDDYISKPLNIKDFRDKLRYWLGQGDAPSKTIESSLNLKQEQQSSVATVHNEAADDYRTMLDQDVMKQLMADLNWDILLHIIKLYIEETERRMTVMVEAVHKQHWSLLESEAHQLKSSSGSVGAILLQQKALAIEMASRAENQTDIERHSGDLLSLCQQSILALKQFIDREEA
ncbi:PAS domain S-box protein [Photobacterium nomapromontoriensis]|uniref:PAS domain S-box protein n=1 Tax=Photobacterium nomapromontoriensis TaxID=2910237 RepID=UPI003D0B2640